MENKSNIDMSSHHSMDRKDLWIEKGTSHYARATIALFIVGFSTFSLIYAVQPLLPELAATFHVSPSVSALSLSVTTGALAISILLAGAASELMQRRTIMFWCMLAASGAHIACAFSTTWPTLLVWRTLEGLTLGGVPAVAMAYLAEEIHPNALGRAMGLYIGGTAFGAMMGRVGVGVLCAVGSWRLALTVVGILDVSATLIFWFLLPHSRNFIPQKQFVVTHHIRCWREHLARSTMLLLFLMGFLALGINVTMFNYLTFRLESAPFNWSQGSISALFLVYLIGAWASATAGRLTERWSRGRILQASLLVMGAGIVLTLTSHPAIILLGIVGQTIGFFATHSIASSWVGRSAENAKGHASSLYLLSYYMGSSILGATGGWFWSHTGWSGVVAFCLSLLACGLVATARLRMTEQGV
ncbi:MFS transporter [Kozakia baliensis]|nr:MFS transporter [Kozakia baliensis]